MVAHTRLRTRPDTITGLQLMWKKSYQRVVPIGLLVTEVPACSQVFTERHSAGQYSDNTLIRKELT